MILPVTLIVLLLSGVASSGWIDDQISKIPNNLARFIVEMMIQNIQNMIVWLREMMMWNPVTEDVKLMVEDSVKTLVPIYIMAITIIGVYILFLSISPSGRAKAKSMLWKTVLSMALVSISFEIFNILLTISEVLSRRMLAGIVTTNFTQYVGLGLINPWLLFFLYLILIPSLLLAILSVVMRYIFVLTLCVIFPFTLFFYFFEFTKDIGGKLLRVTIASIYAQVIQALMLAITVMAMNSIGVTSSTTNANIIYGLLILAGGLMIAFAPLMMIGALKWMGGAVAGIGMMVAFRFPLVGSAMVSMGGMASGMGAGALIAGGTSYGLGRAYRSATNADRMEQRRRRREEKRDRREKKKEEKQDRRFDRTLKRRGVRPEDRDRIVKDYRKSKEAEKQLKRTDLTPTERKKYMEDYKGATGDTGYLGKYRRAEKARADGAQRTLDSRLTRQDKGLLGELGDRTRAVGRQLSKRKYVGAPLTKAYEKGAEYIGQPVREYVGQPVKRGLGKAHEAVRKRRPLDYGSVSLRGRVRAGIHKGGSVTDYFRRGGQRVEEHFTGGRPEGAGTPKSATKEDSDALLRAGDRGGYVSAKKDDKVIKHRGLTSDGKEVPLEGGKDKGWVKAEGETGYGRAFGGDKKLEEDYFKVKKEVDGSGIPPMKDVDTGKPSDFGRPTDVSKLDKVDLGRPSELGEPTDVSKLDKVDLGRPSDVPPSGGIPPADVQRTPPIPDARIDRVNIPPSDQPPTTKKASVEPTPRTGASVGSQQPNQDSGAAEAAPKPRGRQATFDQFGAGGGGTAKAAPEKGEVEVAPETEPKAEPVENAASYGTEAIEHEQAGRYEEAAYSHQDAGEILSTQGRHTESAEAYTKAAENYERLNPEDPFAKGSRAVAAEQHTKAATKQYEAGNYDEAIKSHTKAGEQYEKAGFNEEAAKSYYEIGAIRANNTGDHAGSAKAYSKGADLLEKTDPQQANTYRALASEQAQRKKTSTTSEDVERGEE